MTRTAFDETYDGTAVHSRRSTAASRQPSRPSALAYLLPGVVLAIVLTAWSYSTKPLWRDEYYTWGTSTRSFGGLVDVVRGGPDVGLVGYYGVMHLWMLLGGDSLGWLRLPGAVATVVLVAATAVIAQRTAGRRAGVVAGLLMAAAPTVTMHAQEARPYPLVLTATALAMLAALRYRELPSTQRGWVLAIVAAIPGCLHPIVGLPAVAGFFAGSLLRPGAATRRGVVLTSLPAAAGGGGLVLAGLHAAGGGTSDTAPGLSGVLSLASVPAGPWWLAVPAWVLLVVGAVHVGRLSTGSSTSPLPVLLGSIIVPVVVVAGLGLAGSFFHGRYVSAVTIAFVVLVSAGFAAVIDHVDRPLATVGVGVLVVLAVIPLVASTLQLRGAAYFFDDPRSATRSLADQLRPGDAVVFDGTTARGLTSMYLPPGKTLDDAILLRTPLQDGSLSGHDVDGAEAPKILADHERVWLVGSTRRDGSWSSDDRRRTASRGRMRALTENYGKWRIERWDRP